MSRPFHIPRPGLIQLLFSITYVLGTVASAWSMTLPETPGISWGTTLAQFRQMEVPIEEEWPVGDQAVAVRTGSFQNQKPQTGSLILVFHEHHGLIRIHWASLPIQRDITGTKGIAAFNDIKGQLTTTYGPSSESKEEAGVRLHGFYGDFYQCLRETTCGKWEAIWRTTEGEVVILELMGLGAGAGYLQMTHQGPNMDVLPEHRQEKSFEPEHEI